MKPNLLVYGNCQASWLAQAMHRDSTLQSRFAIHYFPNYGTPDASDPALAAEYWLNETVLIRQVAPDDPPLPFEALLTPDCRQLRYPTLWGKIFWPFNVSDPRNQPREGLPFGPYFYGDRLVVQWLNEGLSAGEILKRYLEQDLSKLIKLERYAEMCFAEMKYTDKQSDITVFPFIEKHLRTHKLFATINHPSVLLLDHILQHIKTWILDRSVPTLFPFPPNAADVLGEEEIPIHPQIIEKLNLQWAWPAMKYRYRSRMLTFQEYIESYIRFDPIPPGAPARLWVERADQAFQQNQQEEAERLLLAGLAMHPQDPVLYQTLTALLTEKKEYAKAYFFLSRALSIPGLNRQDHAHFCNNLGVIQYYQGNLIQARNSFEQALSLQPGWREAADNLQEIQNLTA